MNPHDRTILVAAIDHYHHAMAAIENLRTSRIASESIRAGCAVTYRVSYFDNHVPLAGFEPATFAI